MIPRAGDIRPTAQPVTRLRRPTVIGLVVAVIWGIGLMGAAASVPLYQGVTQSSTGATTSSTRTLIEENGTRVLLPVGLPLLIALVVACLLLRRRARDRSGAGLIAWTIVGLLAVFNFLAMMTIGIFVVPVTAALVVACGTTRTRAAPYSPYWARRTNWESP